jgi:PKD repeat protein
MYALSGPYTVALTVTNCAGTGASTISHDIQVLGLAPVFAPPPALSYNEAA